MKTESFGNSVLGLIIMVIVLWAWYYPQAAGQWVAEYRHGLTGSVVTPLPRNTGD